MLRWPHPPVQGTLFSLCFANGEKGREKKGRDGWMDVGVVEDIDTLSITV